MNGSSSRSSTRRAAGKPVCGPLAWHHARQADNPVRGEQHFTCFQGGSDAAKDLAERQ